MSEPPVPKIKAELAAELRNFQEIAEALKPWPGELPKLERVDIFGLSLPLTGSIGGDHLIYLDFNTRFEMDERIAEAREQGRAEVATRLEECKRKAGILVADVSGHRTTDALVAAMLHQAFLLGCYYELDTFGHITTKLFEHINQRFYKTTHIRKYLTMIYGEISEEGKFRFISAGHQRPMVFSREFRRFVDIGESLLVSFPPVGMLPSKAHRNERVAPGAMGYKARYEINEIELLGAGDVLLLYTDGLSEHAGGSYFPGRVTELLAKLEGASAREICERLRDDLLAFQEPEDDVSFVVAKQRS